MAQGSRLTGGSLDAMPSDIEALKAACAELGFAFEQDATAFLEKALGKAEAKQRKPEFYRKVSRKQVQRAGV